MIDKKILEEMIVKLFESASEEEDRIIPYSRESIRRCFFERKDLLDELDDYTISDEKEINILYQLFHHIILLEVQKITWQMDREGILETGVDEKGEIVYSLTDKGKDLFKDQPFP
jgi:alcohol dehydrogenase YqhD (iron-dependent ADH family)